MARYRFNVQLAGELEADDKQEVFQILEELVNVDPDILQVKHFDTEVHKCDKHTIVHDLALNQYSFEFMGLMPRIES